MNHLCKDIDSLYKTKINNPQNQTTINSINNTNISISNNYDGNYELNTGRHSRLMTSSTDSILSNINNDNNQPKLNKQHQQQQQQSSNFYNDLNNSLNKLKINSNTSNNDNAKCSCYYSTYSNEVLNKKPLQHIDKYSQTTISSFLNSENVTVSASLTTSNNEENLFIDCLPTPSYSSLSSSMSMASGSSSSSSMRQSSYNSFNKINNENNNHASNLSIFSKKQQLTNHSLLLNRRKKGSISYCNLAQKIYLKKLRAVSIYNNKKLISSSH